jgi:hypothetical protein
MGSTFKSYEAAKLEKPGVVAAWRQGNLLLLELGD